MHQLFGWYKHAGHCTQSVALYIDDMINRKVDEHCEWFLGIEESRVFQCRQFITNSYTELKKANPLFPFLVRERQNIDAKITARYGSFISNIYIMFMYVYFSLFQ